MLGPHLMLDFYGCEVNVDDETLFKQILDELPSLMGMKKLCEPVVLKYEGDEKTFDKGGISGFVVIAESHISFHTFRRQKFVAFDVFSCKDFDMEKVKQYLLEKLKPKRVEENFVVRGRNFLK